MLKKKKVIFHSRSRGRRFASSVGPTCFIKQVQVLYSKTTPQAFRVWLKVELVFPLTCFFPNSKTQRRESVLREAGSSVKSRYCYKVPGLVPTVHGGSQPSITLAPGDPAPSLASTSTRHAHGLHTYMQAKHSYTHKVNLK